VLLVCISSNKGEDSVRHHLQQQARALSYLSLACPVLATPWSLQALPSYLCTTTS
jgi:hypothetical protein